MLSPRRMRLVFLAALGVMAFIIFYTSSIDEDHETRRLEGFYHKTVNAMDGRYSSGSGAGSAASRPDLVDADRDKDGDVDLDDEQIGAETHDRLKAAEAKAKEQANEKAGPRPDPPSNIIGVGSSADGQDVAAEGSDRGSAAGGKEASEEERDAMAELNTILKKSPTIIFSKSYCPFSKRAKAILLEKYTITPEPYVVELDEHPLGRSLQDTLEEKTGRRTVPNILINGVSIGGADEIEELDRNGALIARVVDLGSKRVDMTIQA